MLLGLESMASIARYVQPSQHCNGTCAANRMLVDQESFVACRYLHI
jgi:hypothetical protein